MGDTELEFALRSAALEMLALCDELGVERICIDADSSGIQYVNVKAWGEGCDAPVCQVKGFPKLEVWEHD